MKHGDPLWTIDELTAAVTSALAEGYEGAPSGRVRDVPDRRTIRYYTTLGLIDRPSEMRGRTAYYGRRQLLQVVAIKKLQALGRSLAEIQQALTGQPDRELARIAGLDTRSEGPDRGHARESRGGRDFWREGPAAHESTGPRDDEVPSDEFCRGGYATDERPSPLIGVPLCEGVTLLMAPSRPIASEELERIRSAAAPLIDTLIRFRLIDTREGGATS
jgi:DNA-binding transcriptional MerR regulator